MLPNRLIIIILIIITGTFASFYGGNISYAFFYLSLSIPIISLCYTFYVYIRLKMYQTIGKRTVVKGEVTEYEFQISNEDVVYYQNICVLFYQDKSRVLKLDPAKAYQLLPGETQSLSTSICCNYRGEYYVGAKSVTITDFLNLFSITYPVFTKMKVLVLPRIVKLKEINLISFNPDSKQHFNNKNDEEEPDIEVRKYVSGDNKKRIHWKASARKNELFTRKNTSIPKIGVTVYMDLYPIKEEELTSIIVKDKIIESVLAIAEHCKNKHIPCEIYYEQLGLQCIEIQNQLDFDLFYRQCVEMRFHAKLEIDEMIDTVQQKGLSKYRTNQNIIITHNIVDGLYKQAIQILSNSRECGILVINERLTMNENYLLELILEAGVNIKLMSHHEEISDVL